MRAWLETTPHPDIGEQPPAAPVPQAEIDRALAGLRASLTPASPKQVAACLARIALGTKTRESDGGDWKLRSAVYADALGGYPADVWESVAKRTLANLTWFPAVAELAGLLREETDARREQIRRLEWLRARKPSPPPVEKPPLDERLAQIARWRERFGREEAA